MSAHKKKISRIPQRLSAPFGILGDEPKLSFRSQPSGISKLATTRHIPETDSYWEQYITLFDTASDVYSLITHNDIRRALNEAPENIATLLRFIVSRLFNLVSDHTFPSSSNASVTALASSFIRAGTGAAERNATKEVLNCIRVLQRVLPVVFEAEGESTAFEAEVVWKQPEAEDDAQLGPSRSEEPQFVIDDEDDEDGGDGTASQEPPKAVEQPQPTARRLPSLGEKLFSCLIDLLFCCGFTLPVKIQVDHHKINYSIWERGVGSTSDLGPNHSYDLNKAEVLRLLLVLLSRQIYLPSSHLLSSPSRYTLHFVQNTPRRNVLTILCSLLNTAMNSSQSTIESLVDVAGKLPYNHLVFKGEDHRSTVVSLSLQALCVLLDFQSGSAKDPASSGEPVPTAQSNAFRYFLAKLHQTQDFAFLTEGIAGILEQELGVGNMLPGSKRRIPYLPETVLFFWKMIELNKKFRLYVLESDRGLDIFAYLLCYCLEIKDRPQQHGLCRALSYIIQSLSSEPSLGSKITKPVKTRLPSKWVYPGNVGDFMVNAIYSIVATTSGSLNSLYPALIIALANVSPYMKHLTVTSSARLVQLFTSFSNPMFLLSDEGHPRLLFFMLEVFNGPILYNPADNANLIYAILGAHKAFERLGTFTLTQGLREIKRVQAAKEEQPPALERKVSSLSEDDASQEKARLLRTESLNDSVVVHPETSETDAPADGSGVRSSPEEGSPLAGASAFPSDKARGKRKERSSSSVDETAIAESLSAMGVGRNGFVPTQEWVTSWQQGLPLDPVMLTITELLPKIQEIQKTRQKVTSTSTIMDFLGSVNLEHVVPQTPPISPRKFLWSDASIVWLTSLIWGEVYVKGMSPLGIWNGTNVRLFYVKHAQNQPRQISETVSNVVGGILGRTDSSRSRSER